MKSAPSVRLTNVSFAYAFYFYRHPTEGRA